MNQRIPYPDMDQVPQSMKDEVGYPAKPMLNITRMGMHLPPDIWHLRYKFKQSLVYKTTLSPRIREILILRTAKLSNCEYELHHHISISRNLGFSEAMQQALLSGNYDGLAEDEAIAARFADQVVKDCRPDDATLADARRVFGDAKVVEMVSLVGQYMDTARMMMTTGVVLDDHAIETWDAGTLPPESDHV